MIFIVITKPVRDHRHHFSRVMQWMELNVIPFEGLDKRFRHPIGFWTAVRRRTDFQPHHLRKGACFSRDIRRTIITEPLDPMRNFIYQTKAGLDRLGHQVPDQVPRNAARCCHITHDFPITAVQAEGNPYPLPIAAGDFEGIGTPTAIADRHYHLTVMHPDRPAGMALQKQLMLLHDPINTFMVDRCFAIAFESAVQQGSHSPITVSRPVIDNLPNQQKITLVVRKLPLK